MVISHCAANEVLGQRSVLRDFSGLCKAIRIERVQLVAREQLFDRPFVGAVLVTFHKVIGAADAVRRPGCNMAVFMRDYSRFLGCGCDIVKIDEQGIGALEFDGRGFSEPSVQEKQDTPASCSSR